MSKYGTIFLACFFWLSTIHPNNSYGQPQKEANSLRAGAWALQFGITNNFTLKSFDGSVLSLKRHMSDKRALRLDLSVNATFDDTEITSIVSDTSFSIPTQERNFNSQGIDISVQYLIYKNPTRRLTMFFGFGPEMGFNRSKVKIEAESSTQDEDITKRWIVGLSALLGVEWFAIKEISFLAEYGIFLGYQHSVSTRTSIRQNRRIEIETRGNSASLAGRAVKFGLSVYF